MRCFEYSYYCIYIWEHHFTSTYVTSVPTAISGVHSVSNNNDGGSGSGSGLSRCDISTLGVGLGVGIPSILIAFVTCMRMR
jgi:hypothetical protein